MSGKQAGGWAPLPKRAIRDDRLAGLHFRVLAIVAYHDRMSGPRGRGQGCWAGNKKLAEEVGGVHDTNLSTALNELVRWGYLAREPHPMNRRLRIYRVLYDDTLPVGKDALPNGKGSQRGHDDGSRDGRFAQKGPILCPAESQPTETKDQSGVEYIPEKEITLNVRDLAEALLPEGGPRDKEQDRNGFLKKANADTDIEPLLAAIEHELGIPDLTPQRLEHLATELNAIANRVPMKHRLYPMLERLSDAITDYEATQRMIRAQREAAR